MSNVTKRIISVLLVLFVLIASFAVMPPVSASAASNVKYAVSYSGKYVYLKLTPQKSTNKIYYTTDGTDVTRKSTQYKKTLGLTKKTLVKIAEYDKNNKKVATLNIIVMPRVQKPKFTLIKSGDQLYMKLTSATANAKIYYTTNGSRPSSKSKLYSGTFKVKEGMVIRVRAYKKNMKNSKIAKYKVDASDAVEATSSKNTASSAAAAEVADTVSVSLSVDVSTGTVTVKEETEAVKTEEEENVSPAEGVLKLVNEERSKAGVSALTLEATLCAAAEKRAKELEKSYSHIRPDGSACWTVLGEYGIANKASGENIAYGMNTMFKPAEVMTSWMSSTGHRGNILSSSFKKIGVGCYRNGNRVYWVQIFTA